MIKKIVDNAIISINFKKSRTLSKEVVYTYKRFIMWSTFIVSSRLVDIFNVLAIIILLNKLRLEVQLGGWNRFPPPSCPSLTTLSWSWLWTIFYEIFPIKKKIPTFFFGASRINSNIEFLTIFSFSTLRKTVIFNLFSYKKSVYMLWVWVLQYIHLKLQINWEPKKIQINKEENQEIKRIISNY